MDLIAGSIVLAQKVDFGQPFGQECDEAFGRMQQAMSDGSLPQSARCAVWKRILLRNSLEYESLKLRWKRNPPQSFAETLFRIQKDVVRTDRTLAFYINAAPPTHDSDIAQHEGALCDAEHMSSSTRSLHDVLATFASLPENEAVGYVQGMADLASPLLVVMDGSETDAFDAFVSVMSVMHPLFQHDGAGMQHTLNTLRRLVLLLDPSLHVHLRRIDAINLFFCFRWMLVLFRREFSFEDALRIWDVWLAGRYTACNDMHLFVALAIIDMHRNKIVSSIHSFDDILKYFNSLSSRQPTDQVISRTNHIWLRFYHIARSRGAINDSDMLSFNGSELKQGWKGIGCLNIPVAIVLDRLSNASDTPSNSEIQNQSMHSPSSLSDSSGVLVPYPDDISSFSFEDEQIQPLQSLS